MHTLIEELKQHMKAAGTSQSAVASSCGISDATLSYWLRGKYTGNNEDVATLVRDYLESAQQRSEVGGATSTYLVPTTNYNAVQEFCTVVNAHRVMGMLTADAGAGKTTALKAYTSKHPSAILIEADHGYTANSLFKDLCRRLKITPQGCLHDKLEQVVDALKGTGRLVIIDEAEHLNYRTLELIRRVFDKAGVGVAFVGMHRLYDKLHGEPMYYAQIYSRISVNRKLGLLKDADIHAVLSSRYNPVDATTFSSVQLACRRNMRLLESLLRWCDEIMRKNSLTTLTSEVVHGASDMLAVAR